MGPGELASLDIKGFLDPAEAQRLYELAREASQMGPCLEIGSYCGKTASCLGRGCRENGGVLFSIDHHRGSEEQQPGEAYFDEELIDPRTGAIDTLPFFRRTLRMLELEDTVIPVVARSALVARKWSTPLSLVLIDGGHTYEEAFTDYSCWLPHVMPGGFLAIHDIFENPADGGQAPRVIYQLALDSGLFIPLPMVKTLGILRRINPGETPPPI
ncbi:MAG: class I SAM-dependent methyltransferase [Smithellaceae bacterium]|nr:class I SAM-dependent methyltransferase [Smithellaceae bacterium]